MAENKFDIIIIGGGIAGLTAAIYCVRAGKSVAVFERNALGGQILAADKIDNYPGFIDINGYDLIDNVSEQAVSLGVQIIYDNVTALNLDGEVKTVSALGGEYSAFAVILAMGVQSKTLGLKGEKELTGSGVSYCATCDGAFFRGKDVMVAGGGKTAEADIKYLSPIASRVYVVGNKKFDNDDGNVTVLKNSVITEIMGGQTLSGVRLKGESGEQVVNISGLFIAAGHSPSNELIKNLIELDQKGYILTDENMRTNIDGVFACGDIRSKDLRQLVTAASDGAIAATGAIKTASLSRKKTV